MLPTNKTNQSRAVNRNIEKNKDNFAAGVEGVAGGPAGRRWGCKGQKLASAAGALRIRVVLEEWPGDRHKNQPDWGVGRG
jgi:hypothetical protein